MKLKTFYTLFYRHRIQKASLIRKYFLWFLLPFKYWINFLYFKKKINLDKYSKDNKFLFKKDLNFLFEYFNSDKGKTFQNQYTHPKKKDPRRITAHGYSKFYETIFLNLRNETFNILEIGSFYGNASAAFYFYFKNANILGADINPDMFSYYSERVKSFYVNSSSEESIKKNIIDKDIKFRIIIEDASHMLKDQIISLFYLFPKLEKGGYFIIEEIDFPESREDMRMNQDPPDLKTILKNIIDQKDFNSPYVTKELKDYLIKNFESIKFFKGHQNEIAIIKKK
jgi:hypothetical protein|tara:strand:+ start:494 stop:1342 length:849 start_codon:yes stop_codon:yes gene_type:complete